MEVAAAPPPTRAFGAFRLLLALLVVWQHAALFELIPLQSPLAIHAGSAAVLIFFALSGFIISEAASLAYSERPFAFLANRLLRLVPPFLLFLGLAATILAIWPELIFNAFYPFARGETLAAFSPLNLLGNLLSIFPVVGLLDLAHPGQARIYFLLPVWALRLEFAFYVAVFAALLLQSHRPQLGRYLLSALALVLLGHGAIYYSGLLPRRPAEYLGLAPAFVFGVALFLVRVRKLKAALPLALVAAFLALQQMPTYLKRHEPLWIGQDAWWQTAEGTGVLAALVILIIGFVLLPLLAQISPQGAARRLDRFLGDLSYTLYLAHWPALLLLLALWPEGGWLRFLGFIALTLVLSAASLCLIERPLQRLRQRLRGYAL